MPVRSIAISAWTLGGLAALFVHAINRLLPRFLEATAEMHAGHWCALAGWVLFMLYTEGYRGFQLRFSPRFAARTRYLCEQPRPLRVVLATPWAMALFGAPTRRVIASWSLVSMIVCFILVLRYLPQPWRGIVDGGVIVGLCYGGVVTAWFTILAQRGALDADPEVLPEHASPVQHLG